MLAGSSIKALVDRLVKRTSDSDEIPAQAQQPASDAASNERPPRGCVALVSASAILDANASLIANIRRSFGMTNVDFEAHVLPLLERYAEHVHLIPASACSEFHQPGGLFRLCLEIAFYSLQASEGLMFPTERFESESLETKHAWRYACFLSGLFCEAYRCTDCIVRTTDQDGTWPGPDRSLYQWAAELQLPAYHVHWGTSANQSRAVSLVIATHVVPPATMEWLRAGNPKAWITLLNAISGFGGSVTDLVWDTVRTCTQLVLNRNRATLQSDDTLRGPLSIETALHDGMRRLVELGSWTPNVAGEPLWVSHDGVFLVWPEAAQQLLAYLQRSGARQVPQSPDALAAILIRSHIATPDANGRATWTMTDPFTGADTACIHISSPVSLLGSRWGAIEPIALRPVTPAVRREQATGEAPPSSPAQEAHSSKTSGEVSVKVKEIKREGPRLILPLAMEPIVSDALRAIFTTWVAGTSGSLVWKHPKGVFIALSEFAKQGCDEAEAVRVAFEAGLLYVDPSAPKVKVLKWRLDDGVVPGIVVAAQHIRAPRSNQPMSEGHHE